VRAQTAVNEAESRMWKSQMPGSDSISVWHALKSGRVQGHARYFFMTTDNQLYSDYYAHALGLAARYSSASYHGFSLSVGGSAVYNVYSSDLTKHDEASNQLSRYELGLFNILHPKDKGLLFRLEELNARYHHKQSTLIIGNQLLNTPFINLQDGRTRPTEVQGLYFTSTIKSSKIEAAFLNRISPRSTLHWYPVDQSIGLYSQGVNPDGSKSNYSGNLSSAGVFYAAVHTAFNDQLKLHAWNQLVENIFNTTMLQSDYSFNPGSKHIFSMSLQVIRQDAMGNGGNFDPAKTYFPKGGHSLSFGGMVSVKSGAFKTTLNINRITAAGRYLMPREWGKDPFFTFMPRERNDGLGDVTAVMAQVSYQHSKVETSLAAGYYRLPDVRNFALNKYGLPSYAQLNADLKYNFGGLAKGLDAGLLFVYKPKTGNSYGIAGYEINKVDMFQGNMVVNYYF